MFNRVSPVIPQPSSSKNPSFGNINVLLTKYQVDNGELGKIISRHPEQIPGIKYMIEPKSLYINGNNMFATLKGFFLANGKATKRGDKNLISALRNGGIHVQRNISLNNNK